MILSEFNLPASKKINKMNKVLKEHFGVSVATNYPSKEKLEKVLESANMAVVKLRTSNKKFQLEADYAKFLGIRDIVETMLAEGMYAESPSYRAMKKEMTEKVRSLMDKGYSDEEACAECMNQYRMDSRYAFDDDHVKGLVLLAAKEFMEQCMYEDDQAMAQSVDEADFEVANIEQDSDADEFGNPQMFPDSVPVYDEYDNIVAEVFRAGRGWGYYLHANDLFRPGKEKSTGFNDLESAFTAAAIEASEYTSNDIINPYYVAEEFEVDEDLDNPVPRGTIIVRDVARRYGRRRVYTNKRNNGIRTVKMYSTGDEHLDRGLMDDITVALEQAGVTGFSVRKNLQKHDDSRWAPRESIIVTLQPDPIDDELTVESHVNLGHLLQEEVGVEQAEVVMAVRALADDIQDQVERLGRMINEDVPAIADQIRGEMGATESQAFYDQMSQIITVHLESARNTKAQMDAVVGNLTGNAPVAPDMTAPDMSTNSVAQAPAPEPEADEMDINEPAAAGPEDAPLGRAKI